MLKNIALVELYDHSEVLRSVFEWLHPVTTSVHIFTREEIKLDLESVGLGSERISWHLSKNEESPGTALTRWGSDLMACEIVFLLTLNRPFAQYTRLPFLHKTVLLIHDAHAFFAPWRHLVGRGSGMTLSLLRAFRYLLLREDHHLKRLLKSVKIWAFPNDAMLAYAQLNQWIPVGKKNMVLPLFLPLEKYEVQELKAVVNICIPGTIKENGRDYELIRRALSMTIPRVDLQVNLCLLGQPKGKYGLRVQGDLRQLANRHPNLAIKTFETKVPQYIYDEELKNTHFLILPLTSHSRYDAFRERTGYSTISGGVNDMLRFRKPALIPSFYPLSEKERLLTERYDGVVSCAELLTQWLVHRTYRGKALEYQQLVTFDEVEPLHTKLDL